MPQLFNDAIDDVPGFERVESFRGGANGFNTPTLLLPDESQAMENMLVLDNFRCRTRYGADAVTGGSTPTGGKIQGLLYFDTPTLEYLVAVCNKVFSYWNGSTWATAAGFTTNSAGDFVASAQLVNLAFFSDGTQNWRSWDGTTFQDLGSATGTTGSPPVGATIITAHTNRLFASGVASEPDAVWVSDILDAGATKWNHTVWKFRVTGGTGDPIVAMVSLPDYWLLVICRNSFHLVDANPANTSAADWGIQHLPSGIGGVARRAFAVSGNDCLFLAADGIRSIKRMAATAENFEVTAPLSLPMQPYIDRINWSSAYKSCAWTYKQLAFFAVPLDSATEPSHVLVFNRRTDSWMGIWTGWTPTIFATTWFNDTQRLFFGDEDGAVNQWKDYAATDLDTTFEDNGDPVASLIKSRAFNFQEPISMKDAYFFEVRFVETATLVTVKVFLDNEETREWVLDLTDVQNELPVNLPFDLASTKPSTNANTLDELEEFNEAYVEISATSGKIDVKNFTMAAFLNTVRNET